MKTALTMKREGQKVASAGTGSHGACERFSIPRTDKVWYRCRLTMRAVMDCLRVVEAFRGSAHPASVNPEPGYCFRTPGGTLLHTGKKLPAGPGRGRGPPAWKKIFFSAAGQGGNEVKLN